MMVCVLCKAREPVVIYDECGHKCACHKCFSETAAIHNYCPKCKQISPYLKDSPIADLIKQMSWKSRLLGIVEVFGSLMMVAILALTIKDNVINLKLFF